MTDQIWSWALTIVGATCFFLAGGLGTRKVWWAWYIGLFAQVLWTAYALIDLEHRLGFLVGVALYGYVYVRNCVKWTREHLTEKRAGAEFAVAPTLPDSLIRKFYFRTGQRVLLTVHDRSLSERHGVTENETIGVITGWSALAENDFGVRVDWGDGHEIRCDLRELRPWKDGES